MRRILASLISCAALAVGLSTSMNGTALASAAPQPGVYYEIFPPYANPTAHKCLDVPNGTTTEGVALQVFHCHGYDSHGGPQLWQFINVGGGNYWIVNQASGRCLGGFYSSTPGVGQTAQYNCGAVSYLYWQIVPSAFDPDGFELASPWVTGYCLSTRNSLGDDHTPVVLYPCDNSATFNGRVEGEDWRLG